MLHHYRKYIIVIRDYKGMGLRNVKKLEIHLEINFVKFKKSTRETYCTVKNVKNIIYIYILYLQVSQLHLYSND